MREERILEDIKSRLEKLNIYELRQVARAVGVHRPADGKKSRVTEAILEIAQNVTAPEPPSLRGAPPKSQQFDEQLVADIKTCREYYIALGGQPQDGEKQVLKVCDSGAETYNDVVLSGVLDLNGKYYFLRTNKTLSSPENDVFVHESFLNRYSLREGDTVEGLCRRRNSEEAYGLMSVTSVNGKPVQNASNRRRFSELTPVYPSFNVKTAANGEDTACRIIDLFAPLALGQRAVICAPAKAGKTSLIKSIGAGISLNYPQIKVVFLLVDARPEEVTDFKRSYKSAQLFYSTFDMSGDMHLKTARLCMEYCKRLCEEGEDVFLLFDGRASSNVATEEINRLLCCACNAEEGGSVTVVSTLADERYVSLANMCVTLSPELAAKRIFPAIDIKSSYADREESLLSADEISAAANLRAHLSSEEIIKLFKQIKDSGEIVLKYKN
ncbi:MAG: hypothetical protein HDP34_03105 [Clostridia bacterium]|nr:hypothetical protein [Clostridia bacterium]